MSTKYIPHPHIRCHMRESASRTGKLKKTSIPANAVKRIDKSKRAPLTAEKKSLSHDRAENISLYLINSATLANENKASPMQMNRILFCHLVMNVLHLSLTGPYGYF